MPGHQVKIETVGAFARQGQANKPAAMLGHEVDGVRRGHLRRNNKIALIFAVLGVHENEHASVARILKHLLDRRKKARILIVCGDTHDNASR